MIKVVLAYLGLGAATAVFIDRKNGATFREMKDDDISYPVLVVITVLAWPAAIFTYITS